MPALLSVNLSCSKCRAAVSLLDEHDVKAHTVRRRPFLMIRRGEPV